MKDFEGTPYAFKQPRKQYLLDKSIVKNLVNFSFLLKKNLQGNFFC